MSVICQCPSCKTKYQLGDQYAGRTVKCPKCSAAMAVPGGGGAASPAPAAKPSLPVAKPSLPVGQPVGPEDAAPSDSLPVGRPVSPSISVSQGRAKNNIPISEGGSPLERELGQSPTDFSTGPKSLPSDDEADLPDDDLAAVFSPAAPSAKSALHHRSKKKKTGLPAWLIPTIAGVGVAAVLGIAATVYLASQSKAKKGPGASSSNAAAAAKKSGKPDVKVPVLTINWPEDQRAGAELLVNDDRKELPANGAVEVPLPPAKEQYHLVLKRKGFEPQQFRVTSLSDDPLPITVRDWVSTSHSLDWEQDFEAAKKAAAGEHKNVLVLFDASDAKQSSFASGRFREAIATRKEFRDRADKEYVCVYIDNPQGAEAKGQVKDAARNGKLTQEFGITVFPTVIAADAKGRPFGVLEDYKIGGVNAFLELMDKWEADGKELFEMLAKVDALPKGSGGGELAHKALDFLQLNDLERFYRTVAADLAARMGAAGSEVTKEAYESWMRKFYLASKDSDAAKRLVDAFDRWKKTRTFKDREMGATLHLAAASLLGRLNLRKEAAEECKQGLAFEPHDPRVRGLLEMFSRILSADPNKPIEMPVGSGTGFCIAQGNFVLTNHHVIDGSKAIKVRLCGDRTMYAAKLVADNEDGDMAILKIDLPAEKKLRPIPLVAKAIKTGQSVCALGFPEIGSSSTTPTVTQGIASSIPDADDDSGFIVTDCRVNPGNSGGPLCSFNGSIAGMVTAKSNISVRTDSYGLVIPAFRLRKFLADNLPADARKLPSEPTGGANLQLADLNERISPSVVYIENIQEMHARRMGE